MSIIRQTIKYNGNDVNFNIGIKSNINLLGYQQEIDNLTQTVGNDLINPHVDLEVVRFKNDNSGSINSLRFYFTLDGAIYGDSYQNTGLPVGVSSTVATTSLNSFYVFEYYDSYNVFNQRKILTTYITKIGSTPNFTVEPVNQLYYWSIPNYYVNENINSGITETTGYTKISFYNAKDGLMRLFYNINNQYLTTSEKMYFATRINFVNKTWKFINPETNIQAKQLWSSGAYVNRVNEPIVKTENQAQSYPVGVNFDYLTRDYKTT